MNTETPIAAATDPVTPTGPWYRPRPGGRFNSASSQIFASPTFWQNLPRKSILNAPGSRFVPRAMGDTFKKGPLAAAKIVQKFFDRAGRGFARLSTGTIVATKDIRQTA